MLQEWVISLGILDQWGPIDLQILQAAANATFSSRIWPQSADKELIDKEGRKAIHYVRGECLDQLKPLLK